MTIFSLDDEPDEEKLPRYSDPGRILVNIFGPGDTGVYRWEFEVLDHDGCAFWISEGEGFDYWLDKCDFPATGFFVVENITGVYHRGDGYTTDDDVEWNYGTIRPATADEIRTESLT